MTRHPTDADESEEKEDGRGVGKSAAVFLPACRTFCNLLPPFTVYTAVAACGPTRGQAPAQKTGGRALQAFIHIGTEKTGTTSIQAMLQANRANLLGQGVAYLKSPGLRSHRELAAYCMRADRFDDFFKANFITTAEERAAYRAKFLKRFLSELAHLPPAVHTVLASSEHFHSRLLHQDEMETLRQLFAPLCERITVITYLRPQVDTAISDYSTALKCGHVASLHDFVHSRCVPDNPYYNYQEYLQKWAGVFGRENLRVRLFDRAEFVNGDLLQDFLAQLTPGLAEFVNTGLAPQNRSLDQLGQCLLKAVNRHLPQFIEGLGFNELNMDLVRLISVRAAGPSPQLEQELRKAVQARFAAGNEQVRREYFPQRPRLFAQDAATEELPVRRPALDPAQEALLGEVINLLAQALKRQVRENMRSDMALG